MHSTCDYIYQRDLISVVNTQSTIPHGRRLFRPLNPKRLLRSMPKRTEGPFEFVVYHIGVWAKYLRQSVRTRSIRRTKHTTTCIIHNNKCAFQVGGKQSARNESHTYRKYRICTEARSFLECTDCMLQAYESGVQRQ